MNPTDVTLPWLLRLRWAAITGQTATIIFCEDVIKIHLPLLPLLAVLSFTLASQLVLCGIARRLKQPSQWFLAGLLILDTLLLTAMLFFTGGPNNPFSAFYLIHIAMAASLLGAGWTWDCWFCRWRVSAGCSGAMCRCPFPPMKPIQFAASCQCTCI